MKYLETITLIALVISLVHIGQANACEWDSDCGFGSHCMKGRYSTYGVCAGGMNPGNPNDSEPAVNLMNSFEGSICQFSAQCGMGVCVKGRGQYNGVCR